MHFYFTHQIIQFQFFTNYETMIDNLNIPTKFLKRDDEKYAYISNEFVTFQFNLPCYKTNLKQKEISEYRKSLYIIFKLDYESYEILNQDYSPQSLNLFINKDNQFSRQKPIILSPGY